MKAAFQYPHVGLQFGRHSVFCSVQKYELFGCVFVTLANVSTEGGKKGSTEGVLEETN